MIHSQNPDENCDCTVFNDAVLQKGCENFKSLYWNNPDVDYEVVDCPPELASAPPCWEQNGEQWPSSPPAKCANPLSSVPKFAMPNTVEVDTTIIQ